MKPPSPALYTLRAWSSLFWALGVHAQQNLLIPPSWHPELLPMFFRQSTGLVWRQLLRWRGLRLGSAQCYGEPLHLKCLAKRKYRKTIHHTQSTYAKQKLKDMQNVLFTFPSKVHGFGACYNLLSRNVHACVQGNTNHRSIKVAPQAATPQASAKARQSTFECISYMYIHIHLRFVINMCTRWITRNVDGSNSVFHRGFVPSFETPSARWSAEKTGSCDMLEAAATGLRVQRHKDATRKTAKSYADRHLDPN